MALKDAVERLNAVGDQVAQDVAAALSIHTSGGEDTNEIAEVINGVADKLTQLSNQIKNTLSPPAPPASNMAEPETVNPNPTPENPIPEGQIENPS